MKGLQKTCLVLALLILSAQSVRHFYMKYFENTTSVLDKYDKEDIEEQIEKADSLDELVARYDPARKRADQLDALMEKNEKEKPEEERELFREEFRREHKEDYNEAAALRSAIHDWESKSREIRELRIFWIFGFCLVALGCAVYLKRQWLGMGFLIPGVAEMIWWTAPAISYGGTVQEFDRLLSNKLVFTNISLVLVVALWLASAWIDEKRARERSLGPPAAPDAGEPRGSSA